MDNLGKSNERHLYPAVEAWLRPLLEAQFASVHLEVTAGGTFSNTLQSLIDPSREIVFSFLKDAAPDLTGFVSGRRGDRYPSREFVVVEVKNTPIKLDDIYQTRKYAELFDAHYALLVSTQEVPEKLLRLSRVVSPYLLAIPVYNKITFVRFLNGGNSVVWIPDDPFTKK